MDVLRGTFGSPCRDGAWNFTSPFPCGGEMGSAALRPRPNGESLLADGLFGLPSLVSFRSLHTLAFLLQGCRKVRLVWDRRRGARPSEKGSPHTSPLGRGWFHLLPARGLGVRSVLARFLC